MAKFVGAQTRSAPGNRTGIERNKLKQEDVRHKWQPEKIYPQKASNMNLSLILGLVGSIILFIGVFTPILSAPVIGSINYFQNGKGDGAIILILAVVSFVATLLGRFRALWLTGLGCLGILLFALVQVNTKISHMTANASPSLAGNPFAEAMVQSVQLQWGWALLIVGAACLVASAAIKARE